jgi:hypothetical protein
MGRARGRFGWRQGPGDSLRAFVSVISFQSKSSVVVVDSFRGTYPQFDLSFRLPRLYFYPTLWALNNADTKRRCESHPTIEQ